MASYLVGRMQSVRDSEGNTSSWREVVSRVPQGSVLGPLLYSIYVTDLGKLLKQCRHLFYADDLVAYRSCSVANVNECVQILNDEIAVISEWRAKNRLNLNCSKMKSMILGTSQRIKMACSHGMPVITLEDNVIEYCNSVKYLGIILEETLTWNQQIGEVCRSTMRVFAQLKMNGHAFNMEVRKKLVTTRIFPIFD